MSHTDLLHRIAEFAAIGTAAELADWVVEYRLSGADVSLDTWARQSARVDDAAYCKWRDAMRLTWVVCANCRRRMGASLLLDVAPDRLTCLHCGSASLSVASGQAGALSPPPGACLGAWQLDGSADNDDDDSVLELRTSPMRRATHASTGNAACLVRVGRRVAPDVERLRNVLTLVRDAEPHSHLERVIDIVNIDDVLWIAVPDEPRETMADRVSAAGPCSLHAAIRLGRELCEAIAALHDLGVAHGRIDGNTVTADGRGGRLLWPYDVDVAQEAVSLLSPEQAQGTAPTPASDLYALGRVLRHCVYAHGFRSDVSPSFDWLLEWLMRDDPALRPISARDAAAVLDGIRLWLRRAAPPEE